MGASTPHILMLSYLRKMVQKHQDGQLRLDKTLFGLAAGLRAATQERTGPGKPVERLF